MPFAVVPIAGKFPGELRIEHTVRLFIDDLHVTRLGPAENTRGGHIDVIKAVDRAKGTPIELAFDELGQRVDIADRLAQLAKRRTAKYGRMHETLFDKIANMKDGERVPIVVWPRLELSAAPYPKPADRRSTWSRPTARRKSSPRCARAGEALRTTLQRAQIEVVKGRQIDEAVPFARATATVAQIRRLAENKAVGVIFFDDVERATTISATRSLSRARIARTWPASTAPAFASRCGRMGRASPRI